MRISSESHVLAKLRLKLGLGQKEFANAMGVSLSTLQKIEHLKLPLSRRMADQIAFKLGVDRNYLLRNNLSEKVGTFVPTKFNTSPPDYVKQKAQWPFHTGPENTDDWGVDGPLDDGWMEDTLLAARLYAALRSISPQKRIEASVAIGNFLLLTLGSDTNISANPKSLANRGEREQLQQLAAGIQQLSDSIEDLIAHLPQPRKEQCSQGKRGE